MKFPKNFIRATKEYTTFEKHIAAPYFRKKFTVDTKTQAKLLISACGFYELYLNGERKTKGFFAPYVSNPNDIVYFDEYTVELESGENVIAVQLGNGLTNNPGGYIWDFDVADFRQAPKFALSLSYTDGLGNETVIESGEDFKTCPSPIIFDDFRFGEYYDATLEINDWNKPSYDDSDWKNALSAPTPTGEFRICEAEPIVATSEISPTQIIKTDDGYIYDFGVNSTGLCRLAVNGEKGQRIEMQFAEQLTDGKMDLRSVWFVRDFWERDKDIAHKDIYICKGDGQEVYCPKFTYHGFRYVTVTGITEQQATADLLTFVVMNSDVKYCGGFGTSEKMTNTLQQLTLRSDLANFYYFPTDCPHREKNGWTADAALSSEHMLMNLTVQTSFREWMRNICKAQAENGALPGIVPTGGWGFDWGNGPAWDCVLVYLPYFTYIYRGDTQIISESAKAFEKYLNYIKSRTNEDGLIAIGLGDWCHVGRNADGPKAPLWVTDTIISMDIANKAAFLFDVIGMKPQRDFAAAMADGYKAAIRQHLVDFDTMTVKGECQSSQAMGIFYGVFDEDEKDAAFKRLLEFINEQDDHMDVGVLGGRVIFHVLSAFGYSDLALKMIIRPDFPSYGNLIERGATSLWEQFLPYDGVNYSMNHHFWGDISSWFIKSLAGINYNPSRRDLKSVDIRPNFVAALNDASAYFDSNFGKIESSWKRTDDGVELKVTVPQGFSGSIILPDGYCFSDGSNSRCAQSGTYNIKKN